MEGGLKNAHKNALRFIFSWYNKWLRSVFYKPFCNSVRKKKTPSEKWERTSKSHKNEKYKWLMSTRKISKIMSNTQKLKPVNPGFQLSISNSQYEIEYT